MIGHDIFLSMFAVIAVRLLLMASPAPTVHQGSHSWDLSQHVESETVSSFASTPTGHLWMATRAGVRRWDGHKLVRWLPGEAGSVVSDVSSLDPGPSGWLWAALGGGLVACEKGGASWVCRHTVKGASNIMVSKAWAADQEPRLGDFAVVSPPKALADHAIVAVAEASSTLWMGTTAGLHRAAMPPSQAWPPNLHEQSAAQVPLGMGQQTVLGIRKRSNGTLLVNTVSGLFAVNDSYVEQLWEGPVTTVAEDPHGAVWMGTPDGLRKLSLDAPVILDVSHGLADNMVQALAFDAQGGLWVGTRNGLIRKQGDEIVDLTTQLPHPDVTALQLDSDEGMWVALRAGGAVRARRKLVSNFGPKDGLPSFGINGIASDAEGLWISARTSVWLRPPGAAAWQKQDVLPPAKTPSVFQGFARDAQSTLWLADVGRGLWRREGNTWALWHSPQLSLLPGPWALAFDQQGRAWVGGSEGALLVLSPGTKAGHELTLVAQHQPQKSAPCLAPIKAILPLPNAPALIGTDGGGLWTVDDKGITCFGRKEGLENRYVSAMVADGSGAWVGSPDGGLAYFDLQRFVSFTETDGLPCDAIAALHTLGNRLWFTCGAGVGVVDVRDLLRRSQGDKGRVSHIHFNRLTGMSSEEGVFEAQPAAVVDASGTYWTLTRSGLSAITLSETAKLPAPPRVGIEQLSIDGVVHGAGNIYARASDVKLEVKLHGRAISGLRATLFDKQLLGPRGLRTDYSLSEQPVFNNLTPGTYTFTARARSPYGQWGPTTNPIQIVIAAPFHKQPWVLVAALCLCGALAYLLHRNKLRRVAMRYQVVQHERERIARDLHDGLGQGFMALRFALETLRRSLKAPSQQTVELLGQSTDILQHVENESRQTIWNLRAKSLGGESLATTLPLLGKRTESTIIGGGIRVLVEVNGPAHSVDAMTNAELLAVAGEAVMNAVNHARAHEIHLTVDVTPDEVRLAVYDDGRGFQSEIQPDAAAGHFGVLGMRERLRRLRGTFTIESIPGQGTAVVATVPRSSTKELS